MRPESASKSFMKRYQSLPPEARQQLVEKQLAPLLDHVPERRAKKVLSAVNRLHARHSGMPKLNLKGKKKEINELLDELARDSKRAIVRERSNREELLAEIVDSMVHWLNDIWTVVYDHRVHFEEAHACLLFLADVLTTLNNTPGVGGQCRCSITYHPIHVAIRRKGKTIKKFTLAGPRHIDRVLLWIWRDLFVSMFAKDRGTEKIPDMFSDIEEYMDWEALVRMLHGGSKARYPDFDDEDEDEDDDDDPDAFMDDTCLGDEFADEETCRCRLHACHWSESVNEQRTPLRDLVYDHLLALFEITPSHKIYTSIIGISSDPDETETHLLVTLSEIAGSSADTLVAALDIHGSEGDPIALLSLLEKHSYLLRPRDASVLQAAAGVLAEFSPFHSHALRLAERELFDAAAAVRTAVRSAFCGVEDKACTAAFWEIVKLRTDSAQRAQRVDAWVDSVVTPGTHPAHPMAFAAMIMGFPFAAGMEDGDDGEMLGYLDLDPRDPDLEDLREEFRPKLRERFDGWVSTVTQMKGGSMLLAKLYVKVLEDMPYFKANDVAEEMLNRIGDRPNKAHISEAIETVLGFCKMQRKKVAALAEKRRKREAAKKAGASAAAGSSSAAKASRFPASASSPRQVPPAASASSSFRIPGGMDDVD